MSENSIIQKIRQWCEPTKNANVHLGIGDDAALLRTHRHPLVFCSDLMIEGTHFDRQFSTPEDIGHKSLARVLSDVAAMGAQSTAVTISIALPKKWNPHEVEIFLEHYYAGATRLALQTDTAIAGGDLSRLEGPIVIDVAATGETFATSAEDTWRRTETRAGDLAFVTGPLGAAAFALHEMQNGRASKLENHLAAKHLRPTPRFDVARDLKNTPIRSAIDISDSLAQDAARLCEASAVSLVMNPDLIPCSSTLDHALHGGDDYELLLVAPSKWAASEEARSLLQKVGAIRIGHFEMPATPGKPTVFLESASTFRYEISPTGHDPF